MSQNSSSEAPHSFDHVEIKEFQVPLAPNQRINQIQITVQTQRQKNPAQNPHEKNSSGYSSDNELKELSIDMLELSEVQVQQNTQTLRGASLLPSSNFSGPGKRFNLFKRGATTKMTFIETVNQTIESSQKTVRKIVSETQMETNQNQFIDSVVTLEEQEQYKSFATIEVSSSDFVVSSQQTIQKSPVQLQISNQIASMYSKQTSFQKEEKKSLKLGVKSRNKVEQTKAPDTFIISKQQKLNINRQAVAIKSLEKQQNQKRRTAQKVPVSFPLRPSSFSPRKIQKQNNLNHPNMQIQTPRDKCSFSKTPKKLVFLDKFSKSATKVTPMFSIFTYRPQATLTLYDQMSKKLTYKESNIYPEQKLLSKCCCQKVPYDGRFLLCESAFEWLQQIESRTDTSIVYERSQEIFNRVLKKQNKISESELKQIRIDVERTYTDEEYFKTKNGRDSLHSLLLALSKHSSSSGYTQGMNYIAGSLLFHTDEVLGFEIGIRALNDYHLKEIHMPRLAGLYVHCDILNSLMKENLPKLTEHLIQQNVSAQQFCPIWIISLFAQVIPLKLIQDFLTMFWKEGWLALYKVILAIMKQMQASLLKCSSNLTLNLALYSSIALMAQISDSSQKQDQDKFWTEVLKSVADGAFSEIDGEKLRIVHRELGIL